ncbi:DUF6207 family protein [Streptomyces jeddahensis]|uniref:Uncharacterized protein n=1 Tax=Streptomyces jeddahensis TaxID=1716141 RepID=A0A177HTG3_9ACTN|nr:DUF6207 family protein [Streptomyces jeddahensis]OAH14272.1 hypothetical protein STSP_23330 [Streptomyces jeddahensis]
MTANHCHPHQPGLVSLTIEGADEKTVLDFAYAPALCHNVSGPGEPRPVPGRPGVNVQVYGHLEPAAELDGASVGTG